MTDEKVGRSGIFIGKMSTKFKHLKGRSFQLQRLRQI